MVSGMATKSEHDEIQAQWRYSLSPLMSRNIPVPPHRKSGCSILPSEHIIHILYKYSLKMPHADSSMIPDDITT